MRYCGGPPPTTRRGVCRPATRGSQPRLLPESAPDRPGSATSTRGESVARVRAARDRPGAAPARRRRAASHPRRPVDLL
ncbi:MAG: hypothetical protein FJ387_15460 [Verrucomicrobia bacterium]|nr:hypothetical protein [Verrucomicrobiota bacterium]